MGSNAEEMIAAGVYGDSVMIECKKDGANEAEKARIGGTYDEVTKVFIDEKPYDSWILDPAKGTWDAPKTKPDDGNMKKWNEKNLDWEDVVIDGEITKKEVIAIAK